MPLSEHDVVALLRADEPNFTALAELAPDSLPVLRKLLDSGDPELATKAAGLAGKIAAPGQAEVIRHAMQHDLTTVRMAATRAAANLPGQEARRLLGQALQDRDAGVRAVAARVAMTQGAPPLGEELRTAVRQEKDSAVKELMQKAAGRGP